MSSIQGWPLDARENAGRNHFMMDFGIEFFPDSQIVAVRENRSVDALRRSPSVVDY